MVGLGFPDPGETVAEVAWGLICLLIFVVTLFA